MRYLGCTLLVALVCSILAGSPAHGANILGAWHNSQFSVTMTLHGNGTFTFRGPQGTSSGRWAARGWQLSLQEANGRITAYRVAGLTDTRLQLIDAYGVQLTYERAREQQQQQPHSRPSTRSQQSTSGGGRASGSGKTLAAVGNHTLRTGHLDGPWGIVEFVVGATLGAPARNKFNGEAITEFRRQPQTFLAEMKKLTESYTNLRRLTTPQQIATGRQQLLASFWQAARSVSAAQRPLMLRTIFSQVTVLATDAATGLVLTNRDVAAATAYLLFAHQQFCTLMGSQLPVSPATQRKFQQDVVRHFSMLPKERKEFICSATVSWSVLQANWPRLNSFQQGQLTGSIAARFPDSIVPTAQPAAASGYGSSSLPNSTGSSGNRRGKSLAQMRRDFQARQNCFTIMNNMSLQNHATMLNTIENFGGTGNYWEVTPGY